MHFGDLGFGPLARYFLMSKDQSHARLLRKTLPQQIPTPNPLHLPRAMLFIEDEDVGTLISRIRQKIACKGLGKVVLLKDVLRHRV